MEGIRIALIGYGGMGRQYAGIIGSGSVAGMTLSGICCRNAGGQEEIRRLYPEASVYRDVSDTFDHAWEFDAVLIVTPHDTHVEIGKRAAAAGKHIMSDKPAGISTKEVRELMREIHKSGVSYAVMFNTRVKPAIRKAAELLESGSLGELTRAVWVCNTWYRTPAYHRSAPWRSTWRGEHGGLLINQCQHYLDIWQYLFGLPSAVNAAIDFGKYNDFRVDDGVDLQFFHRSGLHGTFVSSSGENPGVNRLEVWGTRGRLCVEDCRTLTFDENVVSTREFALRNQEIYGELEHHLHEIAVDTGAKSREDYKQMLQNFADHICGGQPLIADGEAGLGALMMANGAYLSAWQEKKVYLPIDDELYARLLAEQSD